MIDAVQVKRNVTKKEKKRKGVGEGSRARSIAFRLRLSNEQRLHYTRATFRNGKIEKSGIDWLLTTRQRQGSRFHEGKMIVNDP